MTLPLPEPGHMMMVRPAPAPGEILVRCVEPMCRVVWTMRDEFGLAHLSALADLHARYPDPETRQGAALARLAENRYSHDIAGDNARGSDLAIVYGK